jgi:hypothetical protein
MEDKVGQCARPTKCSTIFQRIAKVEKGERHHLEKVVQMEAISNLCASRKIVYKDHAKKTRCAHGRAPWRTNHENGHREEVLLARKSMFHYISQFVIFTIFQNCLPLYQWHHTTFYVKKNHCTKHFNKYNESIMI